MELNINGQKNNLGEKKKEPVDAKKEKSSKNVISTKEGLSRLASIEPGKESFEIPAKAELKKKKDKDSEKEKGDKFYTDEIKKKIDFHVMPDKFRLNREGIQKAKNMGVVIMISGALFLIILSIGMYVFLFKEKSGDDSINNYDNNVSAILDKEVKQEEKEKESEEKKGEELENNNNENDNSLEDNIVATSTDPLIASSSDEEIKQATSTPSQEAEADIDGDGLSSKEELIFGTSNTNVNTDGDNYDDITELNNLYNPAGDGKLVDNLNIGEYKNNFYNYKILYPAQWEKINVGGDNTVMFNSNDGHFIQIITQENSRKQSIKEWLAEQLGEEAVSLNKSIENEGWSGIENTKNYVVYITDDKKSNIFVISYSFGTDDSPDYKNIFNMIVDSFEIENQKL